MPQRTPTPLRDRLRDQRLRFGWTLRQLATKCEEHGVKVDHGQLGRIERREAVPHPALGKALGDLLDVDPATAFWKEDQ